MRALLSMVRQSSSTTTIPSSSSSSSSSIAILLQRRIHPFLRKRFHRNHQLLLLFLLVCIHVACVTGSVLLALEKDISWLNVWWGSCVLYVFLDLFVFQVICSAMVDFAIPNIIYDRYRQLN